MKFKSFYLIGLVTALMLSIPFAVQALDRTGKQGPGQHNFIADFDTDGDGQVSLDEFPGPDAHFSQLDADKDGYLSEDEAPKGPPSGQMGGGHKGPGQGNGAMADLDKDGDGLVSQDEFPGPDDHFTRFDTDKDGYLSEDELPKGPPPGKNGGQGHGGMS